MSSFRCTHCGSWCKPATKKCEMCGSSWPRSATGDNVGEKKARREMMKATAR